LVCNPEALKAVPRKWQHKLQLFPVNGVPSAAFDGFTRGVQPGGKYRILTAGRLVRLKAFDLAIEGFKTFVERTGLTGRGDGAKFTIVGDGPELPRLRGLVCSYGLQKQVRFETWKPQEELWSTMRSCDVFLFPSLRDGGGLVVVEAMAAGKPVICVDLGGPAMHVTEDCGVKVAPLSPEQVVRDLAAALERLYQDPELRLQMGEAARKRAERIYHWDRLGERLLEIYQSALGLDLQKTPVAAQ
jgi:glycosyltransferase involved in cell wall biosynthesis